MADLRNSISLTDRMSPVLKNVLKAMDSTLNVMKQLDKASDKGATSKAFKRAEKDIKQADNALKKLRNHTDLVDKSADSASKSYSRLGSAVNRAGARFNGMARSSSMFLQSLASGVYLAQQLANAMSGVMNTADAARSQAARLGLYNNSDHTNEELYGQVFRTSMDTRSGLTDTADLANKLLIADVFAGKDSTSAAISTAGLINKALLAGGGTSEENARALRQLTQGLASGVLQGDELRSIREQTPYFAQMLAEGLGQVDDKFKGIGMGDLKELGAQGELTSERVIKAMWAMQDEINDDFTKMPKTFGQAMTSLTNIWQYFLWMLSATDGPLGKINAQLWRFVEYLQSPQGLELLDTLAVGISMVATALSAAMGAAGSFVTFLQENVPIAQALLMGLGTAALIVGIKAAAAWAMAAWPILLIIALVSLVTYAFLSAGFTIQEIIGGIAGGILAAIAVVWNFLLGIAKALLWFVSILGIALVGLGTAFILVLQGVVQLIMWGVREIVNFVMFLEAAFKSAWTYIAAAGQAAFIGLATIGYGVVQGLLKALSFLAKGIDAIFGSDFADTLDGWSADLKVGYEELVAKHDPGDPKQKVKDIWTDYDAKKAELYANEQYSLNDEMGNVWAGAEKLIEGIKGGNTTGQGVLDDAMWNVGDAFDTGFNWGEGLIPDDPGLKLPDNSVLDQFSTEGIQIKGGDLDSVGSIKSDVDIGDEDIKLLRDMAARDYLLQLQTITPVANVKFGDVRETADVGKIIEVIEDMVEEQMATSLVG